MTYQDIISRYQGCTILFKREQGGGGGAQIKLCEWQLLPLASKRESRFSIWRNSNNTLCSTK